MSEVSTMSPVATDPWATFMQRAMSDPSFDINKFAALLEMRHREMEQQRLERAEQRKRTFSEALTAFQGEVDAIVRDAINPFLKNKYATLQKTVETAQPYMKLHGLNVRYVSDSAPAGWLKMGIVLGHDCGYEDSPFWMSVQVTDTGSKGGKLPMTPSQAVAATMTYLRRQLYTNALNLVAGEIEPDDDGEALRSSNQREPPPGRPAPPQRTQEQWLTWVSKLRDACDVLRTEQEHDEVGKRDTLRLLLASPDTPDWVKEEAFSILADARERIIKAKTEPATKTEDDEPPPVIGEDKLMAG